MQINSIHARILANRPSVKAIRPRRSLRHRLLSDKFTNRADFHCNPSSSLPGDPLAENPATLCMFAIHPHPVNHAWRADPSNQCLAVKPARCKVEGYIGGQGGGRDRSDARDQNDESVGAHMDLRDDSLSGLERISWSPRMFSNKRISTYNRLKGYAARLALPLKLCSIGY